MPVPVLVHDKLTSALHHLVSSLPEPPPGPPPAFTDRDTWIKSLPPARRYKLRLMQSEDLAISSDLPPTKSVYAPLSNGKPWPPPPPSPLKHTIAPAERRKMISHMAHSDYSNEDWTEDEVFFPRAPSIPVTNVIKRHSNPFPSSSSSPIQNVNAYSVSKDQHSLPSFPPSAPTSYSHSSGHTYQAQAAPAPSPAHVTNNRKPHPSPVSTTVTPVDMALYKHRIADPLSAWLAKYIWKVVTEGLSLPPEFVMNDSGYGVPTRAYAAEPPTFLAENIRTLLCATLLQPSAVFLALWYIARFPVYFGVFAFDPIHQGKYYKFRLELVGEGSPEPNAEKNRQLLESHAPFRLFLLGVMLANKWLDDNTFSNKTWHQVSGVPIRALNKLEVLGLDLLSHDLSLPSQAWIQWLEHIQSYHRSLAPYPEPIGPPKETPHAMIRQTIDELVSAGNRAQMPNAVPAPVFLDLVEQRAEHFKDSLMGQEQYDLFEVDLDKDGPLREEYLPKRKTTKEKEEKVRWLQDLPPPAEWSPAGDPPIHRVRPVYQAVQGPAPPPAPILPFAYPVAFPPTVMGTATNPALPSDSTRFPGFFPDPHKQDRFRAHQLSASSSQIGPFSGSMTHVPSVPYIAPVNSGQYRECHIPNATNNVHCRPEYIPQRISMSTLLPAEGTHAPWAAIPTTQVPMPVTSSRYPGSRDAYRSAISPDTLPHHPLHYLFRPTWLRT